MAFDKIVSNRRLRLWAPGLLAALMLAGCQMTGQDSVEFSYTGPMTYDTTDTSITTQPLQELATLDQSVVSGTITVFVEEHKRIAEVSFFLDDPHQTRDPIKTDASVPYDLLLDTTTLVDGEHTLTAVARLQNGRPQTLETATFVTSNNHVTPLPDEEPVEDPAPEPTEPELRPLQMILPVYNDKGVRALTSEIAPYVRDQTRMLLVSGNVDKVFDANWVNANGTLLQDAFSTATVLAATSGHANVASAAAGILEPVQGVAYIYEPNFPNEPEFSWDFSTTLENVRTAAGSARGSGLRAVAKPTGRPLYQSYLYEYGWNYGDLAMEVDELFVQTQTYCKGGPAKFREAVTKLVDELTGSGTDTQVFVQVSIDPSSPNGVTAVEAIACLEEVRAHFDQAALAGLLVWWSPAYAGEAVALLRDLTF